MAITSNVLSVVDVKRAENEWAVDNGGKTWPLMVRAAKSFVRKYLPFIKNESILVVTGSGNNGGDGYYIGKLLLDAGINVVVYAPLGEPKKGIDAERAREEYVQAAGLIAVAQPSQTFSVIIDALFGSGLERPLSKDATDVIQYMNHNSGTIFSVDIPSGLNSATGQPMPVSVKATATHSFVAYKPGSLTAEGPSLSGTQSLDTLDADVLSHWIYDERVSALPNRSGNTHKSEHGSLAVIGGFGHMTGAGLIASRAALNAGAGRVYLQCGATHFSASLVNSPEIMFSNSVLDSLSQSSVLVVGPGMGRDQEAQEMIKTVLNSNKHMGVLDADALRYLAKNPQSVSNWVLTPHESEAADLLDINVSDIQGDRVSAALALQRKFSTTVVLKGSGTLVAHQQGLNFCHPGSPAMATPGMGDCLAGIIAALLAQGLSQVDAAIQGVNWHASLGKKLADSQRLVLASDLCELLKAKVD